MLSEIRRLSNLQVVFKLVDKTVNRKIEDYVIVYFPEEEVSSEDETIEKLADLKRFNNRTVPPQKKSSVND